jgi:hypothetical protein
MTEEMIDPSELAKQNTYSVRALSQDTLNELLYWRDHLTAGYWRIGDIANALYDESVQNDLQVTRQQINAAIGHVIGKSGRTVRLYATVAAFFSSEIRQKYDVLPYAHFVFAMGLPGNARGMEIPAWQALLDLSLDNIQDYGLPPSVDALEGMYHKQIQRREYIPPFPENPYSQIQPPTFDDNGEVSPIRPYIPSVPVMTPQAPGAFDFDDELRKCYQRIREQTAFLAKELTIAQALEERRSIDDPIFPILGKAIQAMEQTLERLDEILTDPRVFLKLKERQENDVTAPRNNPKED